MDEKAPDLTPKPVLHTPFLPRPSGHRCTGDCQEKSELFSALDSPNAKRGEIFLDPQDGLAGRR